MKNVARTFRWSRRLRMRIVLLRTRRSHLSQSSRLIACARLWTQNQSSKSIESAFFIAGYSRLGSQRAYRSPLKNFTNAINDARFVMTKYCGNARTQNQSSKSIESAFFIAGLFAARLPTRISFAAQKLHERDQRRQVRDDKILR